MRSGEGISLRVPCDELVVAVAVALVVFLKRRVASIIAGLESRLLHRILNIFIDYISA